MRGGDESGDAEAQIPRLAYHDEVLHVGYGLPHPQSRDHGREAIKSDSAGHRRATGGVPPGEERGGS